VTDGLFAFEHTRPTRGVARLEAEGSEFTVDLGASYPLQAFILQRDGSAPYVAEVRGDEESWRPVWTAPAVAESQGFSTKSVRLAGAIEARYVRIRRGKGQGSLGISELEAFCRAPAPWPPRPMARPGDTAVSPSQPLLDRFRRILVEDPGRPYLLKGALASASALLLFWGSLVQGKRRTNQRLRDSLLLGFAVLGLAAWPNFGVFRGHSYLHLWDVYHYYFGAKYAPELEYTRLYACTALADSELGYGDIVASRRVRDLETNRLGTNDSVLAHPSLCKDHFTTARWESFIADVAFFHTLAPIPFWSGTQLDHGYNGTPFWVVAGHLLTNLGPASSPQILLLTLVDSVLLVIMWLFAGWAFGWRAAAVAAIFFGTNAVADFSWVGGSLLRFDWLVLAVIGICLLKRGRPVSAAFALSASTLLRGFPGLLLFGIALKVVATSVRNRRVTISRDQRSFLVGGLASVVLFVPLSLCLVGGDPTAGVSRWKAFADNSRKHLGSPMTNNVGAKTLLSYVSDRELTVSPDEDVLAAWWAPHDEAIRARKPVWYALLIGVTLLLARAAEHHEESVATILSIGLIPVVMDLSSYYYAIFLAFGFLLELAPSVGTALLSLSAATCFLVFLPCARSSMYALFVLDSVGFLLISLGVLGYFAALHGRPDAPPPAAL
jgi:hypothetical protein